MEVMLRRPVVYLVAALPVMVAVVFFLVSLFSRDVRFSNYYYYVFGAAGCAIDQEVPEMSKSLSTVLCIENEGNEVSLQVWKIYKSLPDSDAEAEGMLRVIDEEGEDYLFPRENFASIELPANMQKAFERSVNRQRRSSRHLSPPRSLKVVRSGEATRKRSSRSGGT